MSERTELDWASVYRRLRDPACFPEYCADFLKIQTKEATLSPLVLERQQLAAWAVIEPYYERGGWFLILKARQAKVSTLCQAISDHRTTLRSDVSSLTMAHLSETSSRLHKMLKMFHNHKPGWLRPVTTSSGNKQGISFSAIRSSMRVLTAGSELGTSGDTFQLVHLSEFAKWEHPEGVMASLSPALPKNALVFIESTPFGIGNMFYQMWVAAKEGNSDYIPIFIPWFDVDDYKIDKVRAGNNEPYDAEPTKDERYYVEMHNLSQAQVNWMRWATLTQFNGNFDTFLQEYPFDDVSCFLSSGRPYFDIHALQAKDLELRDAPSEYVCGEFDAAGKFFKSASGDVVLWDVPVSEEKIAYRYVVSADTCEGGGGGGMDDEQKKDGDTDWNYCVVRDRILDVQVAEIRNKKDPDQFAAQLFWMVKLFGNGLIPSYWPMLIVERNNTGQAVLMELKRLYTEARVPFTRLFHRGDMTKDFEPTIKELGFLTRGDGEAPRLTILAEVQRRIREGRSGVKSRVLIGQCVTFVKNKRMRPEAQSGRYDDGVIALALNYEGERRDNMPWELPKPIKRSAWVERIQARAAINKRNPYA